MKNPGAEPSSRNGRILHANYHDITHEAVPTIEDGATTVTRDHLGGRHENGTVLFRPLAGRSEIAVVHPATPPPTRNFVKRRRTTRAAVAMNWLANSYPHYAPEKGHRV